MSTVRKTITLTSQQDEWIKAQISAGHYTNDSEYVRDLIRKEQERNLEYDNFLYQKVTLARQSVNENQGKPHSDLSAQFAAMRQRITEANV